MLDDEASLFGKDDLRLPLKTAGILAERRPQQKVDLALRRTDTFAVVVLHELGVFYLPEVRALALPGLYLDEKAVSLFGVPNEYQISRLDHLSSSLTPAAMPAAVSPISARTSLFEPESP